jgi:hypothetical protein
MQASSLMEVRIMAKRRTPRDRALVQLRHLLRPGAVVVAQVEHDDDCRIWEALQADACDCQPHVTVQQPPMSKKEDRP